jgi:hypothetical protein
MYRTYGQMNEFPGQMLGNMLLTSASKGSVKSESGLPMVHARVTMKLLNFSVTSIKSSSAAQYARDKQ